LFGHAQSGDNEKSGNYEEPDFIPRFQRVVEVRS
jgi:hypothetical protein